VQNTAGPALWHFDTYNGPEGHITPALYLYDTTWAAFEPATPCSGDLEAWCEDLGSGCSFDHQLESDHIYRLVATTYWDYDDGPYRVSYSTNGGLGAVRTASCPTCPVFPQEDTKERVMPRLWDGDAAYLYNEGRVTVPWYGCASYLIGSPLGVSNADESGRWDAARYPE
jgi:hypothetical protein